VNVAVIDVGSNTIRLLVACRARDGLRGVYCAKNAIGLGSDVEQLGAVSAEKIAEAASCVRRFASDAWSAGAVSIEIVVASPGRQAANADQLVHVLTREAGSLARVLSRDEEAHLAFDGALAGTDLEGAVAVCDIGGGSAQIAVGTAAAGPAWLRSVDLGSLRLATRVACADPPTKTDVASLRSEAQAVLARLTPPLPASALAVGGTARSLRRLVGRTLGPDELKEALRVLRKEPAQSVADRVGIELWRARTLPAGAVILAEIQRLLGVPFEAGRGGLREGLALELLDRLPAAQARAGR
jgi:exopolyphosphatase/guanosine-5'-triphosphate,3'-diphosphate pyrophosphatase